MNDIISAIRSIFPFVSVWFPQQSKVDKAISGITGAIESLNEAAVAERKKSDALYDESFELIDKAAAASNESRRAKRLSDNLYKLVQ